MLGGDHFPLKVLPLHPLSSGTLISFLNDEALPDAPRTLGDQLEGLLF